MMIFIHSAVKRWSKFLWFLLALLPLINGNKALAETPLNPFKHRFYAGIGAGLGSTTWRGLVPVNDKETAVLTISTPTDVKEGGGTYNLVMGYEFTPYFALEGAYQRYPKARVMFEEDSLFAFEHDDLTSFQSNTDTLSLMAKVMLLVPRSFVRMYAGFGLASVHRYDEFNEYFKLSPTFGAGFNWSINERFIVELGFNYTTGDGESEISPANHYIPFLYSGMLNVNYRF